MSQPKLYKYVPLVGKVHEITAASDKGIRLLLANGYCYSKDEAIRRHFNTPQLNEEK